MIINIYVDSGRPWGKVLRLVMESRIGPGKALHSRQEMFLTMDEAEKVIQVLTDEIRRVKFGELVKGVHPTGTVEGQ